MYEPEEDYMHEEEESEEIPIELWQESSWITISAFFEEKGSEFHNDFYSNFLCIFLGFL